MAFEFAAYHLSVCSTNEHSAILLLSQPNHQALEAHAAKFHSVSADSPKFVLNHASEIH